jgi:ribosome-associated toxin RatA of RatAB toxin-antitoxin module
MERIAKAIEVNCPIRTVYNQWTQFEEFPRFMSGVKSVRQLDDTHVHWRADIWGKDKEWDAEITEQVPDRIIAWRSMSPDAPNGGTVRFEPVSGDRTRVSLEMEYEPQGAMENIGDSLGAMDQRVANTIEDFKKFIESRGSEEGGWRGEVHGGRSTRSASSSDSSSLGRRSSSSLDESSSRRSTSPLDDSSLSGSSSTSLSGRSRSTSDTGLGRSSNTRSSTRPGNTKKPS